MNTESAKNYAISYEYVDCFSLYEALEILKRRNIRVSEAYTTEYRVFITLLEHHEWEVSHFNMVCNRLCIVSPGRKNLVPDDDRITLSIPQII